jgi:hypothetical protein
MLQELPFAVSSPAILTPVGQQLSQYQKQI